MGNVPPNVWKTSLRDASTLLEESKRKDLGEYSVSLLAFERLLLMQNQSRTEMTESRTTPPTQPAMIGTVDLAGLAGEEFCEVIGAGKAVMEAAVGPLEALVAGMSVDEVEIDELGDFKVVDED